MLCTIIFNSITIKLTMHTSCYCGLRLFCVALKLDLKWASNFFFILSPFTVDAFDPGAIAYFKTLSGKILDAAIFHQSTFKHQM